MQNSAIDAVSYQPLDYVPLDDLSKKHTKKLALLEENRQEARKKVVRGVLEILVFGFVCCLVVVAFLVWPVGRHASMAILLIVLCAICIITGVLAWSDLKKDRRLLQEAAIPAEVKASAGEEKVLFGTAVAVNLQIAGWNLSAALAGLHAQDKNYLYLLDMEREDLLQHIQEIKDWSASLSAG